MIKRLPKISLEKENEKLNRCLYYNGLNVYKNCEESLNPPSFLNDRLRMFQDLPDIGGYTKPISFLEDDGLLYGYEMEYLKEYRNLHSSIIINGGKEKFSFLEKKEIITQLFICLKALNEYMIVFDIGPHNIMIDEKREKAIIIDWENGRCNQSLLDMTGKYSFLHLQNEQQADAIKMFNVCLMILYNRLFTFGLVEYTLDDIYVILKDAKVDREILQYLEDFIYEINTHSGRTIYFDDYLPYVKKINGFSRKRVINSLKENVY